MTKIRIIGGGIAGSILAMTAHERGLKVSWWQSGRPTSSLIAAGIYNPIVLKRLKLVWRAQEFSRSANQFYDRMKDVLPRLAGAPIPIWHRIHDNGYLNDWEAASTLESHRPFLGPIHQEDELYAEVRSTGRLDTPLWLELTGDFIKEHHNLQSKEWTIEHHDEDDELTILCTGWKASQLPYGIPEQAFSPVKGEVLTVHMPGYQHTEKIIHGGVFILPTSKDEFRVGATYSWDALDEVPTQNGKDWLMAQLRKLWNGPVEIIKQEAGVRPAVKDRKPILGKVPNQENLYVLNGLGSRGTLMGPLLSQWLLDHALEGTPLPEEVNLARFY